jgi:hypothetical protein
MLDYDGLPVSMELEERLSRLTRWVLDADAAHMRYGLRLPDAIVGMGNGVQHREQSLTALAVCKG